MDWLILIDRFNHPIEVSNKQTTPAQQEMKDFEFAKQEVQRVQEARQVFIQIFFFKKFEYHIHVHVCTSSHVFQTWQNREWNIRNERILIKRTCRFVHLTITKWRELLYKWNFLCSGCRLSLRKQGNKLRKRCS